MTKKGIFAVVIFLFLFLIGLHFLLPIFNGSALPLIVLSGSMHPFMRVEDIVISESLSPEELVVGDVITFHPPTAEEGVFVTHRIIYINSKDPLIFQTKGDANEDLDPFLVSGDAVKGKIVFVIPYAGYLPQNSKNKTLFVLLILLPASILILDELKNIIMYINPVKARKAEKKKRKLSRRTSYKVKSKYLVSITCICCILFLPLLSPYFGGNGWFTLQDKYTKNNPGQLSSVLVLTPENGIQNPLYPGYSVISPSNSTTVDLKQEVKTSVSYVPYILPVFWIISLSQLHPLMPIVSIFILYTLLILLITLPIWYRKIVKKKRITYRQRLYRLKRYLHFV
ncbi:signal peptidase I [uncultured Methanomethylovorans sp.]|uniref:signal peptidase I n=1 Tax=uncultured Methanomethylovorans sp. TaxID=183759 RepID=UPI002AA8F034|nr:signal peptidase I [uncultured Methanomethylovorans sp.]